MGRNIIICCDGTGKSAHSKNATNILKIYNFAEDIDQKLYYDAGVATIKKDGILSWIRDKCQYLFGYGITKNIKQAYSYIQKSYEEGDKIFLFGFSRGAYTIRSLDNLIYNCGLCLDSKDIDKAVDVYKNIKNWQEETEFKRKYSRHIDIEFMGVFDTVAALGFLHGKKYFDVNLNPGIKNAYHVVAIDEKRKHTFKPELWENSKILPEQNIQQVWFTGVHSDVGGGYKDCGLSDITLKWMIEKACLTGMEFHQDKVNNIRPNISGELHSAKLLINGARVIPEKVLIHNSVFKRINDGESKYSPENLPKEYVIV